MNKIQDKNLDELSPKARDEMILRLESERLLATENVERIVNDYARESGNRSLRRKKRVGAAPNDYVVKK